MIDNDGNGLVDDATEGGFSAALVQALLNTHQPKTARAEVLYAILVEGKGPLGSVFTRDDFTDKEVQDTDGDGMPEFVDAWGQPLQFYRWPLMFHSDSQKGYWPNPIGFLGAQTGPYASVFEPREQNPLDPNQTLMAPQWWASYNNGPLGATSGNIGGGVLVFQSLFHSLIEPNANPQSPLGGTLTPGMFWDRATVTPLGARRAFYSKFLIASGGADQELGIARADVFQAALTVPVLLLESQARQTDLNPDYVYSAPSSSYATAPWTNPSSGNTLLQASSDDITNHNYQAPGGVVEP
jgi:hypothetical protein